MALMELPWTVRLKDWGGEGRRKVMGTEIQIVTGSVKMEARHGSNGEGGRDERINDGNEEDDEGGEEVLLTEEFRFEWFKAKPI